MTVDSGDPMAAHICSREHCVEQVEYLRVMTARHSEPTARKLKVLIHLNSWLGVQCCNQWCKDFCKFLS
jgi:hypothetical protein